jgi:transposase-like protein
MDNTIFQQLMEPVEKLTPAQKISFQKMLDNGGDYNKIVTLFDDRVLTGSQCPRCKSAEVRKFGRRSGLQRMRCRACGRTYNALTGTPLARPRKKREWLIMGAALQNSLSVRKTAEACGVCVDTAFRRRHRFLKSIQADMSANLVGITEADETYFLRSNKGERGLETPRKRGGKASTAGISDEHVAVLVARDRSGGLVDAVLPDKTKKAVAMALRNAVNAENILCIDGGNALWSFVNDRKIPYRVIPAKKHVHEIEPVFHLQGVNAHHSRLKLWMSQFRGVATRYLSNYVGWQRMYEKPQRPLTPIGWMWAAYRPSQDVNF